MERRPLVLLDARDGFAAPLRGWGRYARELAGRLPQDVVALHRAGGPWPEVVEEQVVLPARALAARARVLHAPNCFLPLVRPCAGVVTVHDLAFEAFPDDFTARTGAKYRWATPRAARSAERVIVPSQATADDLQVRYGIEAGKVRVIPNAPSLPLTARPVPDRAPYVLAVGDLRAKKNLGRLVDAWRLARTGHGLVLAGHGELDGPPPPGVEVTGYVDDGSLDALMRGADLLVHPSLYEGFGLVVVEAMARGVPVAAADATSLPEVAGDAAVLFDPTSVEAIAAAIVEALGCREELRMRGLARAERFSWAETAERTLDVYRELL